MKPPLPTHFCVRCGKRGTYFDHELHTCSPENLEDEQPEDDGYCYTCCGTGEGQFDGTRCQDCRGKGFTRLP